MTILKAPCCSICLLPIANSHTLTWQEGWGIRAVWHGCSCHIMAQGHTPSRGQHSSLSLCRNWHFVHCDFLCINFIYVKYCPKIEFILIAEICGHLCEWLTCLPSCRPYSPVLLPPLLLLLVAAGNAPIINHLAPLPEFSINGHC